MNRWSRLVAMVAVAATVAMSGCTPGPEPSPSADPDTPAGYGELISPEQTITWTPQPDGSVQAVHRFIFDTGQGKSAQAQLMGYVSPIRLLVSKDFKTIWSAKPVINDVAAKDTTRPDSPSTLTVARDNPTAGSSTERIRLTSPNGWSGGRHVVEVTYRWSGVWVDVDGNPMLVLPNLHFSAPWYDLNDRSESVRVSLADHTRLLCRGDNPNYEQIDKPCNGQIDGVVGTYGQFNGMGSVSYNNTYYFVRRPSGVASQPAQAIKEVK